MEMSRLMNEDTQVTNVNLAQIEDHSYVDEWQNIVPEALASRIDDVIERLDNVSRENVYLTILNFAMLIVRTSLEGRNWLVARCLPVINYETALTQDRMNASMSLNSISPLGDQFVAPHLLNSAKICGRAFHA
jgi:hypothetical protein